MIRVILHAGLGNRMFQYAVGRRIAEDLGYEFRCPPIPGFPGTYDVVSGERCEGDPVTFSEHTIDMSGLRAGKYAGREVVLQGYFMVYDYLRGAWPRIRRWFRPAEPVESPCRGNDLVVHWRVGDYVERRRPWKVLPAWLVRSVVDKGSWDRVFVVTDTPEHPPIHRFAKRRGATVMSGTKLEDFEFIRHASNILLSTSSFSWWAAVLSDANRVFYPEIYNWHPVTVHYPGAQIPAERLFPYDQPRFQKIPGPTVRTSMTLVRIPFYRSPHNVYLTHLGKRLRRVLSRASSESTPLPPSGTRSGAE